MFNPQTVSACLAQLVGFPRNYLTYLQDVDSDLTTSLTGVYVDSTCHPLINQENIQNCAKDFLDSNVKAWSNTATYSINDIVSATNKLYRSIVDSNTNQAVTDGTKWKETTLISAYLRRVANGAAINLFNRIFTEKKLYEAAKTLLSDTSLYDGVGNIRNTVSKLSRFVGYKFKPVSPDTVINISHAGLQFNAANPDFNLYVYHSSQNEPVLQVPVPYSRAVSFTWKQLDAAIKLYYNNNTNIGDAGIYYIGYYEDDLVGNAIWSEQNFIGRACSTCSGLNNYLYNSWSKYVKLQPFYIEQAYLQSDKTLFDTDRTLDLANQTWGLNFKLQVSCDVSDFICRNKLVFTDAYKWQITRDLIKDMAYSVRDNQMKQKVQQMAMLALNGDKNDYATGVEGCLEKAVKAVSFDISDMNSICLPCNTGNRGIRTKTAYR